MSSVPRRQNQQESPYKNPKKNEDEMKGTVMRPPGPTTAATSSAIQKQQQSPATSPSQEPIEGEERPVDPSANRITLALLEEHAAQRAKGYDPYNAGFPPAAVDAWKQKRKRD